MRLSKLFVLLLFLFRHEELFIVFLHQLLKVMLKDGNLVSVDIDFRNQSIVFFLDVAIRVNFNPFRNYHIFIVLLSFVVILFEESVEVFLLYF